jgi:single-strand DNA-binding protein
MNLNKVFIIGNLTRDPELKTLPSGTAVASFGVATNRTWKDQSGQKKEEVQFHNIVVFGRQAETVSQYLTKGSSVLVEGRIQTRNWDAQDGSKKSKTEIVAERVQFGPRRGAGGPVQGGGATEKNSSAKEEELATIEYPEEEINPEEIPF